MCVIAYKKSGLAVSLKTIKKMIAANPDGIGLAYYSRSKKNKGKIIINKHMQSSKMLHAKLQALKDYDVVFHCRIATAGKIDVKNRHPFLFGKNSAIFQNGCVHAFGNNVISDTCDFTNRVLSKIDNTQTILDLLNEVGSKWILMRDNKFYFVGEFFEYKRLKTSNLNFTFCHSPRKNKKHIEQAIWDDDDFLSWDYVNESTKYRDDTIDDDLDLDLFN